MAKVGGRDPVAVTSCNMAKGDQEVETRFRHYLPLPSGRKECTRSSSVGKLQENPSKPTDIFEDGAAILS